MASSRACLTQFSDITNIDPFQEERLMKNVAVFSLALLLSTAAQAAEYMEKTPFQLSRAFSPGVITSGGSIVWGRRSDRDTGQPGEQHCKQLRSAGQTGIFSN